MNDDSDKNPLSNLPGTVERDLSEVEELIRSHSGSDVVDRINQVAAHLYEGGGKRLRPILTLSSALALGYQGYDHIRLAAAVEFVHTATLVHDDVVDESSQRRGRPTANFMWDNKTSVLVGDYMFARSFQLMVATKSVRSLSILADASATISEAEVLQLVMQNNLQMSDKVYLQIIRGKTATLFAAATSVGGVVAGASEEQIEALTVYGDALGVGFQIMDDLLDYTGTAARLGKNVGDDFRDRKVTLPVIMARKVATRNELAFWNRSFSASKQEDGDLEQAIDILDRRGILVEAHEEARCWADRAKKSLADLQTNEIGDFLCRLADFAVSRSV